MIVQAGKGIELEVPDYTTLNQAVLEHILYVGWRNLLMDSHAGVTAEKVGADNVVEKSREAAQRKLQSLINGEVRTVATRETDPVKAEAAKLLAKALMTNDRGLKPGEAAKQAREQLATKPNPKLMAQAKKNVEAAKALAADLAAA
jgi:hypothetical protein